VSQELLSRATLPVLPAFMIVLRWNLDGRVFHNQRLHRSVNCREGEGGGKTL